MTRNDSFTELPEFFENLLQMYFMRKTMNTFLICFMLALALHPQVIAHTLFMTVEDNEDGTVTIQGMFSTGAIGTGIEVRLEDENGKSTRIKSSLYFRFILGNTPPVPVQAGFKKNLLNQS